MTISYVRPPCNPDGSRKSYAQRRAERRQQEAEQRAAQQGEPIARAAIYDLPADERRRLRQAEAMGRREGAQRAAIEEQAKKQAEHDATPEHLRRPHNPWRDLIDARKPDAYRADVARRIKIWEQDAQREDERIDALMAEKLRRHELESPPEYAKALAHWEQASAGAESEEERREWARLKGLIDGGGALDYWNQVSHIMVARLKKVQADIIENAAKQAPFGDEAKALADKEKATEELQVQLADQATKEKATEELPVQPPLQPSTETLAGA